MGRHKKFNPQSTTSISVSDGLHKNLWKHKPQRYTMDQFLTKVLTLYLQYNEEYPQLLELAETCQKKNNEYSEIIKNCPDCRSKLTEFNEEAINRLELKHQFALSSSERHEEFKTVEQW